MPRPDPTMNVDQFQIVRGFHKMTTHRFDGIRVGHISHEWPPRLDGEFVHLPVVEHLDSRESRTVSSSAFTMSGPPSG